MYACGTAKDSDIPIAHLDFSYIGKCTDEKKLEKIINVLRSGSEGYYPDLLEFTENKLLELNPKSHVLRKDNPVESYKNLDKETQKEVGDDLKNWTSQMKNMDDKLTSSGVDLVNGDSLPPVRATKTLSDSSKKTDIPKSSPNTKETVKPREYSEWDKFDIDKELSNVDKEETVSEPKNVKNKPKFETKSALPKDLNKEERSVRALKEKAKGNEAFKAQDYEEAIAYYSNSLNYETTPASYNNRAAAELKLERYKEAVEDCNMVLRLEPNNLKAHLRRGLAHKALKMHNLAIEDFNIILKIDADNKRAKELLAEIEQIQSKTLPNEAKSSPKVTKKSGQRMKIIEISDSDDDNGPEDSTTVESSRQKSVHNKFSEDPINNKMEKGQRIKIEDVETTDENIAGITDEELVDKESERCASSPVTGDGETLAEGEGVKADVPGVESESVEDVSKTEKCETSTGGETEFKDNRENDNHDCNIIKNELITGRTDVPTATKQEFSVECTNTAVNNDQDVAYGDIPIMEDIKSIENAAPVVTMELPDEVKTIIDKASYEYKAGQYSEACQNFSKGVDQLWGDRHSYKKAVSSLLSNKAACYLKMGESKECIEQCNLSLEMIDDSIRVLLWRGLAYETLEKYAEAFHDFNRVRLLDSSHKVAQDHCSRVIKHLEMLHGRTWRSKIFEMNKNNNSEQQTFPIMKKNTPPRTTVTTHTETISTPQANVACAKSPQKKPSGCEKSNKEESPKTKLDKYLKLKENGNTLVKQGKHSEAVECYTDCIKLCPEEVAVYTNRALCYLQLSKHEDAEADCTSALKIQENNIKALFRRAKARKGMNKYRESSGDLVTLLKLDSKNLAAKNELTEVLQLLKKEKKDAEKSAPQKRKRILIKDIEDDTTTVSNSETTDKHSISKGVKDKVKTHKMKSTPPLSKAGDTLNEENTTTKTKISEPVSENTSTASAEMKLDEANPSNTTPIANIQEPSTASVKHNVKTAFQFVQTWKNIKKRDTPGYLNVLKQINISDLPKLISNRLDDMINTIFNALQLELKSKEADLLFVYNFLEKLRYVDRFDMVLMFQSQKEKQALVKLFDDMVKQNKHKAVVDSKNLSKLHKKYCS